HKPDPQKMAAFRSSHPQTAEAFKIIQGYPVSSGFDNATFNSLSAFRFVNDDGASTTVRWSFVPEQPFSAPDNTAPQGNPNYLFDALIASIHQHPLKWRLIVSVWQPGYVTNNATIPWPEGGQKVDVGTLTLDSVESDDLSPQRDLNFDPLALPVGILPSD